VAEPLRSTPVARADRRYVGRARRIGRARRAVADDVCAPAGTEAAQQARWSAYAAYVISLDVSSLICYMNYVTLVLAVKTELVEAAEDTANRSHTRARMDELVAGVPTAGDASGLMGKRVAIQFARGTRKTWFPAVITTRLPGNRFKLAFADDDQVANRQQWTVQQVQQGLSDYDEHVAPALARLGPHTTKKMEYGTVERFFLVKLGAAVHRFAFVKQFKTMPTSADRAYVVLNGQQVLGADGADDSIKNRVVEIDEIHGNVLFSEQPATAGNPQPIWVTPFIKN